MRDVGAALAVGAMVAVVLAGGVVAGLEVWGKPKAKAPPPRPALSSVARIGPDGTARTRFGDDVRGAVLLNSQSYHFCYGDMRVTRPSMMTTDMPDAFCTVSRDGRKGPWRISTGGWQECQAVCFKPAKK